MEISGFFGFLKFFVGIFRIFDDFFRILDDIFEDSQRSSWIIDGNFFRIFKYSRRLLRFFLEKKN